MIALINIVSKFRNVEDKTRPPSGLLYIGGALRSAGHEVRVFHIYEREIEKTLPEIQALAPLYVAFSVFTGYPCYTSAIMSRKLKKLMPSVPIVWGGVHPSLDTERCLREDYIDFAVVGEGEETILELTGCIAGGKGFENVKGLGYKQDGAIKINPRRELIRELDKFSMDWSLVDPNEYVRPSSDNEKTLCYITSRGCPFNCGFCYNEKFNMRRYRSQSVAHVVAQIRALKEKTGITRISFDDDHFMVDNKRGFEILSLLKDMGISCDFLELRLEKITAETMGKLREFGVKRIFFGWESGSNRILKMINKEFTKEYIIEKCKVLADFPEILIDASAIIGFPTETWDEVQETVDLALEMADILPNVTYNLGTYMPYPGTALYTLAQRENFKPPERIGDWKDFDILSGKTDPVWIRWADRSTKKKLFLIDKYAHYISKPVKFVAGRNPLKYLGRLILYSISRFRLKHRIFIFPYEIFFHELWTRWSIIVKLRNFNRGS